MNFCWNNSYSQEGKAEDNLNFFLPDFPGRRYLILIEIFENVSTL